MQKAMIVALLLLGGCTTAVAPSGPPRAAPVPLPTAGAGGAGLDRVMGREAAALVALLGRPDAEVIEGDGRKLQFSGPICVLDAYLYPRGGRAVVTHVDARQSDGSPIDRASCVAALTRRGGGR